MPMLLRKIKEVNNTRSELFAIWIFLIFLKLKNQRGPLGENGFLLQKVAKIVSNDQMFDIFLKSVLI